MADRLFDLDEIPEVPLFREPPPGRGAQIMDERISHDYPPEWNRCTTCGGDGKRSRWEALEFPGAVRQSGGTQDGLWRLDEVCPDCLGMGSVKARVRLEAGHRCVRCLHPYVPKGDAKMLGVDPTPYRWSPCDERCLHGGPIRYRFEDEPWCDFGLIAAEGWGATADHAFRVHGHADVEAEWRILTVHHLDGDKANLAWWNLAALCQRCHLEIQGRVVMERVYPHEHSEWFRPYVAGYYASVYLGESLSRAEVAERLPELLALERFHVERADA